MVTTKVVESLDVRVSEQLVAELGSDQGQLSLRYAERAATAVSLRLPLCGQPYLDDACRPFFANLLPEAAFREGLCRRLALSASDDFPLLRVLGQECAGRISLGRQAELGRYVPVSVEELTGWLSQPDSRPLPAESPGLYLALSGAQDKLAIHLQDGQPYLCEGGAPSTLILKPDIAEDPARIWQSALNELFCMKLAQACGLRVPPSSWLAGAFAVQRFDRVRAGSFLQRAPQEDFCQLLGLLPAAKYDVSWAQCFGILDRYAQNADAGRRELLDRLFFNLLIGNADAHGKNFALWLGPDGLELAPGYDLLCTQIYPSLSDSFAMRIGPARRQEELTALAWSELARDARVPLDWIKQRGELLTGALEQALQGLGARLLSQNPELSRDAASAKRSQGFLAGLTDLMVGNCKRVARSLALRA